MPWIFQSFPRVIIGIFFKESGFISYVKRGVRGSITAPKTLKFAFIYKILIPGNFMLLNATNLPKWTVEPGYMFPLG